MKKNKSKYYIIFITSIIVFCNSVFVFATPSSLLLYKNYSSYFISSFNQSDVDSYALSKKQIAPTSYQTYYYYVKKSTYSDRDTEVLAYGFNWSDVGIPFIYNNSTSTNSFSMAIGIYNPITKTITNQANCVGSMVVGYAMKNNILVSGASSVDKYTDTSVRNNLQSLDAVVGSGGFTSGLLANTNTRFFNDIDGARSYYLNGFGSSANEDMVNPPIVYDSSVETPQNVRVEYNNSVGSDSLKIDVVYSQTQDYPSYKTEVKQIVQGQFFETTVLNNKKNYTDFKTEPFEFGFNGNVLTLNRVVTLFPVLLNPNFRDVYYSDSFQPYKILNDKLGLFSIFSTKLNYYYYYVRNIDGYKSSDWVVLKVNVDTLESTEQVVAGQSVGGITQVMDGITEVYDGDTPIEDIISNSVPPKETYEVKNESDEVKVIDSSNFVDFVKSAFGLLDVGNEKGLVSFMSSCFGFIPGEFFGILLGGISIAMIIVVIKFLRG